LKRESCIRFALNQKRDTLLHENIAVGNLPATKRPDHWWGTFSDDYTCSIRNEKGLFRKQPEMACLGECQFVTWATEFIDYDNDGWQDLLAINGHVFPEVDRHRWGTSYAQRPYLLHNVNNGAKFEMVPAMEGTGLATVMNGAERAFGDLVQTAGKSMWWSIAWIRRRSFCEM